GDKHMESAEKNELFRLLSALCDEELTPPEGERLAELLRGSPEMRVAYVRYIDLHASLDRVTTRSRAGAEFASLLRNLEEELGLTASPAAATRLAKRPNGGGGESPPQSTRFRIGPALAPIASL